MDVQLAGSRGVTAAPRMRQEGEGQRAKAKRRRATGRALRAVARDEFGPSGWMVVSRLSRLPLVRCGARAFRRAKASPALGRPLAAAEACLGEAAAPFLHGQGVSAFVTDRFLCKVLELAVSVCPCIASPPSQIDKCRRLRVIDCGVVDVGNTFQHKCPPQLLVFDLRTDELIARHRFNVPAKDNETTFMLNVIAEQKGGFCSDDAFAYIADTGAFAMYVFSLRSQRSWRVASDTFLPESNAERIEVNGSTLMLQDGVLGLALNDRDDYLYYHSFSSFQEGRVLKAVLQEEALFADGNNRAAEEFSYIGRRQSQSAGEALAMNSVMLFHQMGTESIYCWDRSTEYTSDNHHVVEHNSTLLHFVTGMKAISQGYPEELWVIDDNGQRVFTGEFQANQPRTVNIVRGYASYLSQKCKGRWYR